MSNVKKSVAFKNHWQTKNKSLETEETFDNERVEEYTDKFEGRIEAEHFKEDSSDIFDAVIEMKHLDIDLGSPDFKP
jgi:hypothetical protein